MQFIDLLKEKQMKLEMGNTDFAKYLGVHRTWLLNLYNPKIPEHPIRLSTMFKLHNRIDIPMEVMEEYNLKHKD